MSRQAQASSILAPGTARVARDDAGTARFSAGVPAAPALLCIANAQRSGHNLRKLTGRSVRLSDARPRTVSTSHQKHAARLLRCRRGGDQKPNHDRALTPKSRRRTAMISRSWIAQLLLLVGSITVTMPAVGTQEHDPDRRFDEVVRPFLNHHCLACHGADKPKAKLDLSVYTSVASIRKDHHVWSLVLERLEAEEMPPAEAKRQPAPHDRRAVIEWLTAVRDDEIRKNLGDPGVVKARRLSNAEFDYTVRDLTGCDIRPTREFPVDPANEAGFDNSGESLTMSPLLLKKYIAAARRVADHLVLKESGFSFAPDPAVTDTDRDKYCVLRIVEYYRRHAVDSADYFLAAWRFRHRKETGKERAQLQDFAAQSGLSPKYLATVWGLLEEPWPPASPLGQVQLMWQSLPADGRNDDDARRGCEKMRDRVIRLRATFQPRASQLNVRGISTGSQPFVLWRNRQKAGMRMRHPDKGAARDLQEFCRVFPDAFFVSGRPSELYPTSPGAERPLTAGFHLMQGYFRDDAPLCALVLDDAQRRELDALWQELNFVTLVPMRQFRDFIFFEREEPPRFLQESLFDFARSEDKDVTSSAKVLALRAAYLAKACELEATDMAVRAIDDFFTTLSAEIRHVEQARRAAEPSHLDALLTFTERAYRRPLSLSEALATTRVLPPAARPGRAGS